MEQQLFLAATELFFDMSPLNAEAVKPHPKCHPAAETVAWKLTTMIKQLVIEKVSGACTVYHANMSQQRLSFMILRTCEGGC